MLVSERKIFSGSWLLVKKLSRSWFHVVAKVGSRVAGMGFGGRSVVDFPVNVGLAMPAGAAFGGN